MKPSRLPARAFEGFPAPRTCRRVTARRDGDRSRGLRAVVQLMVIGAVAPSHSGSTGVHVSLAG
ncbi:MAG TPA: hypothetical protein VLD86_03000, partial [Ilumatobacteraceae bacterium]|nr:hypothetical protein [Ilumatobacteraceae bacterium]